VCWCSAVALLAWRTAIGLVNGTFLPRMAAADRAPG
jgi:hypothetical protein